MSLWTIPGTILKGIQWIAKLIFFFGSGVVHTQNLGLQRLGDIVLHYEPMSSFHLRLQMGVGSPQAVCERISLVPLHTPPKSSNWYSVHDF